jgi:hypothetical protein
MSMASVRGSTGEGAVFSGRGSVAVTPETLIAADPVSGTFQGRCNDRGIAWCPIIEQTTKGRAV